MKIFLIIIYLFASLSGLCAKVVHFKGRVICAEDRTPIYNCYVILKSKRGVLVQHKTDSLGYYAMNYKYDGNDSIEIYTQTDKTVTTPSAKLGFLASDDRAIYTLTDSSAETTYIKNFELIMVQVCDPKIPSFRYKKQSLEWDTIEVGDDSEPDSNYYYPKHAIKWIVKLMKKNPTIIIELSGHCSSEEFTTPEADAFSLMRAEVVKLALMKYGIAGERMEVKGWGERKLRISDAVIEKQKEESEKEMLRSINRRVVFKIISWDYRSGGGREVGIPVYHAPLEELSK